MTVVQPPSTSTSNETPRRTVRIPDDEWQPSTEKAAADGETIAAVIRRLLRAWRMNDTRDLDRYRTEYRATAKTPDADGHRRDITNLTGSYDQVRQQYPARHWDLEERVVSPYRPAIRQAQASPKS
ncbi:hypothetical protein OG921_24210 [Aldersonia sp. NBC_00410]|uniref:hypothetical protein n=1 Tax=Aldersonia sp. NBC_00410 TaxID=2975954 RepID=UPI0022569155|nr:hypothetical protein [Aldersonia sp. NBC_00410]MCX5046280.1 hypothetical protein [Aldersonia sp. NBC_00410]